jgi:X-Pro dipeptidyl-peptidase-like protein
MRVRRGIPVIAADGARLLLDHYSPVPGDPEVGRVVVWIRTPYGRKGNPPASQDGIHTVVIDLIGIAHCFRAGHRLRLQISSGAHPRLVRNTGTGAPLATATELRPAAQEIFHDPQHPLLLTLPRFPTTTLRLESTS